MEFNLYAALLFAWKALMSHTSLDYIVLNRSLIHFLGLGTFLDGEATVGLTLHIYIFRYRG